MQFRIEINSSKINNVSDSQHSVSLNADIPLEYIPIRFLLTVLELIYHADIIHKFIRKYLTKLKALGK